MAPKDHLELPPALRYLRPFVRSLAKLAPEDLNEDVDAAPLDAALRKRIRGLDKVAASQELAKDRELLAQWLKTSATGDHPAHWVLGFLMGPGLADGLVRPPKPPRQGPTIFFDAPAGWRVKILPFQLELRKGKLFAVISAIDELSFRVLQRQMRDVVAAPGGLYKGSLERFEVAFGESFGNKRVCKFEGPQTHKRADYNLCVPGGFVSISVACLGGADFDESPIESQLDTLRLSGPRILTWE